MRIVAAFRDLQGDDRRQKVMNYLEKEFEVVRVPARLGPVAKLVNYSVTFSPNRVKWRERSKKTPVFFRVISNYVPTCIEIRPRTLRCDPDF